MRSALVAATLALGLGGCVAGGGEVPEWFSQRSAEADAGYPSLRSVPTGTDANTNAAHWAQVETDVVAAGQAVRSHPRAAPATETQDPAAFLEEARQDLEETRQSHAPN